MTDPQWLKAEEVAAALRISTRAVYRLVKTKQLRGVNLGRTVRIPAAALEAYLQTHAARPTG